MPLVGQTNAFRRRREGGRTGEEEMAAAAQAELGIVLRGPETPAVRAVILYMLKNSAGLKDIHHIFRALHLPFGERNTGHSDICILGWNEMNRRKEGRTGMELMTHSG